MLGNGSAQACLGVDRELDLLLLTQSIRDVHHKTGVCLQVHRGSTTLFLSGKEHGYTKLWPLRSSADACLWLGLLVFLLSNVLLAAILEGRRGKHTHAHTRKLQGLNGFATEISSLTIMLPRLRP